MSTLSKLVRNIELVQTRLSNLHEKLAVLKNGDSSNEDSNNFNSAMADLNKLQEDVMQNVLPVAHSLLSKLDSKDPVSGAHRYGDGAKQRILKANQSVTEILSSLENLKRDHPGGSYSECISPTTENNDTAMKAAVAAVGNDQLVRNDLALLAQSIRSIDSNREFVTYPGIQTCPAVTASLLSSGSDCSSSNLHCTANVIRERKAQELCERKIFHRQITCKLQEFVHAFNRQASVSLRKESDFQFLRICLAKLCNNLEKDPPGARQQCISKARKLVLGVLERVISSPDDVAARTLRITHPSLQRDLTGLVGGIELLLALGFKAEHTTPSKTIGMPTPSLITCDAIGNNPASPPTEDTHVFLCETDTARKMSVMKVLSSNVLFNPDLSAVNNEQEGNATTALAVKSLDVFHLLAPNTCWELYFHLQEPPVDNLVGADSNRSGTINSTTSSSSDSESASWLDWYDGLVRARDIIQGTHHS